MGCSTLQPWPCCRGGSRRLGTFTEGRDARRGERMQLRSPPRGIDLQRQPVLSGRCEERDVVALWMKIGLDFERLFFRAADNRDRDGIASGDKKRCIDHILWLVDLRLADLKQN